MSPRSRRGIEELFRSARPEAGGYAAVEVEPAELRGLAPTSVSEDVVARVVTPADLREPGTAWKAVELSRSGPHVVVDTFLYRERDRWELPVDPETYERLLEHVVTVREESSEKHGGPAGERVRYYRPSLTTTDVELSIAVLLDIDRVDDLAAAHTVGLAVAAELHAAALRLALSEEGERVIRNAESDPAIPAVDYLDLPPEVLAARQAAFDSAMAGRPRALRGVFSSGMVTIELTRDSDDGYQLRIISILARAGKHETAHPISAENVPGWCRRAGAPVDAFEWSEMK